MEDMYVDSLTYKTMRGFHNFAILSDYSLLALSNNSHTTSDSYSIQFISPFFMIPLQEFKNYINLVNTITGVQFL